jgi:hypothetical protein
MDQDELDLLRWEGEGGGLGPLFADEEGAQSLKEGKAEPVGRLPTLLSACSDETTEGSNAWEIGHDRRISERQAK